MVTSTLSNTARTMLETAAQHEYQLTLPPERLPTVARRTVVQSMLKSGLLEEIATVEDQLIWRTSKAGEQFVLRATSAGLAAVAPATAVATPEGANESCDLSQSQPPNNGERAELSLASAPRPTLRVAATALLAAWDTTANGPLSLAPHFDALRATIAKPSRTAVARQPRTDTKRSTILTMLRRQEGATVAQVAEATGWARHTVHGFFAGLKKAGTPVEIMDRVRQVGPGKQGAAGSYTVYRIEEAG